MKARGNPEAVAAIKLPTLESPENTQKKSPFLMASVCWFCCFFSICLTISCNFLIHEYAMTYIVTLIFLEQVVSSRQKVGIMIM